MANASTVVPPGPPAPIQLGFHGIVRVRLDPVIVLIPSAEEKVLEGTLNPEIALEGTCLNLEGQIDCSLDWLVKSDEWDTEVRAVTCTEKDLRVEGKDGKYRVLVGGKPLESVSVLGLGLIGHGKLGYRITLGSVREPLVVDPKESRFSFRFPVTLVSPPNLRVGTMTYGAPAFAEPFKDCRVRVTVFEEVDGKERERHHAEDKVSELCEDKLVWRAGCVGQEAAPTFDYVDHLEQDGILEYGVRLEFLDDKVDKNGRKVVRYSCVRRAVWEVPMPHLYQFGIELGPGPSIIARATFGGFDDDLSPVFETELYALPAMSAKGVRARPLRDVMIDYFPLSAERCVAGHEGDVGRAIEHLLGVQTGVCAKPAGGHHVIDAVLLDFAHSEDGQRLLLLWNAMVGEGHMVFAELRVSPTMTKGVATPMARVATFVPRLDRRQDGGLVPVNHGAPGAPYYALGVGSKLIDFAGDKVDLPVWIDLNERLESMDPGSMPGEKEAAGQRALAEKFVQIATKLAERHNVPPALILGIMSRESRFGEALDKDGCGDGGNGFGIMQVDRRYHAPAGAPRSAEHLEQAMGIFCDQLATLKKAQPTWREIEVLAGAVAAYNAGPKNITTCPADAASWATMDKGTTQNNYSRDTWARALWFAHNLSW